MITAIISLFLFFLILFFHHQIKCLSYSYRQNNNNENNGNTIKTILWIEKLLKTPVADFRKNSVNLILSLYLINIKNLSNQESFDIFIEWLQNCNSIKKLEFNSKYLVKSVLNIATKKRIPPMKLETLRNRNLELYHILKPL